MNALYNSLNNLLRIFFLQTSFETKKKVKTENVVDNKRKCCGNGAEMMLKNVRRNFHGKEFVIILLI